MSTEDVASSKGEETPANTPPTTAIPQISSVQGEDTTIPQSSIQSPLNPDTTPKAASTPTATASKDEISSTIRDRAPRTKKESLKKREGGGDGRNTPDVKVQKTSNGGSKKKISKEVITPQRYHLPVVKAPDFEVSHPAVLTPSHVKIGPGGEEIQFCDTGEQYVYLSSQPQGELTC